MKELMATEIRFGGRGYLQEIVEHVLPGSYAPISTDTLRKRLEKYAPFFVTGPGTWAPHVRGGFGDYPSNVVVRSVAVISPPAFCAGYDQVLARIAAEPRGRRVQQSFDQSCPAPGPAPLHTTAEFTFYLDVSWLEPTYNATELTTLFGIPPS
jgi:hypothetical protein